MPNAFHNTEGDLRLWMGEVPLSTPHRRESLTLFQSETTPQKVCIYWDSEGRIMGHFICVSAYVRLETEASHYRF